MPAEAPATPRDVGHALAQGDLSQAARLLRRLAADEGRPHAERDQATLALARLLLLDSRGREALDTLQPLLQPQRTLAPQHAAEVARLQADLALTTREPLQALAEHLQRAAALDQGPQSSTRRAQDISRAVELLAQLGEHGRARQLLLDLLRDTPDLPPTLRRGLTAHAAILGLHTHDPEAAPLLHELLQRFDASEDLDLTLSVRILYARALLQLQRPQDAAATLDRARQDAVKRSDPIRYLLIATLLAQAYESSHQRPEAYGTLLRAQLSLQDRVGPEGAQLPKLLLDAMLQRWGQDAEAVISTFHQRYNIPRVTP